MSTPTDPTTLDNARASDAAQSPADQRVSPTALYTSEVWIQNDRSFIELSTGQGWVLYKALAPAMKASKLLGGPTLADFLLARHDLIDHCLHEAISMCGIQYVIEIAAGMSPRGMRFTKRYGKALHYYEGDLPFMVQEKNKRIAGHLNVNPQHRVVHIDAFAATGANSLAALVAGIPPGAPIAVVTEGLLNYFDEATIRNLWKRIGAEFKSRPGSVYVSDIHLEQNNAGITTQTFKALLSMFVRGRVHLHFGHEQQLIAALEQSGLSAKVLTPSYHAADIPSCAARGADLTSVVLARGLE